jgi:hypothetical protein
MNRSWKVQFSVLVVTGLFLVSQGVSAATSLSSLETQMKLSKKVAFGATTNIALPNCARNKSYVLVCTFETIAVTVKSFKFLDLGGWPKGTARYAISLKMVNNSKSPSGVQVDTLLRCKNSHSESTYYDPGLDPETIPAGAKVSGVAYMSFPAEVTPKTCLMPTLWIEASGGIHFDATEDIALAQKANLVIAVYIPLTSKLIATTVKKK